MEITARPSCIRADGRVANGVAVELARSGENLDAALNRIQKEPDRLNGLVGQLLKVTCAEGDPSSLRRNTVQLDQLVQQLVDDSLIEAAAHGCGVKFEKREPVKVEGHAELPRRAVENVIRYAPPRNGGGSFAGAPITARCLWT